MTNLQQRKSHTLWWITTMLVPAILMTVALYYQYALEDDPCVLCVQVRLYTCAFFVLGLLGFMTRRIFTFNLLTRFLSILAALGFLERSWQVFSVERGLKEGSCGFSLGFPDWLTWFKPDIWLPSVFNPTGMCGQSPEMIFGLTMADGLMIAGVLAVLACLYTTVAYIRN